LRIDKKRTSSQFRRNWSGLFLLCAFLVTFATGCRQDMADRQPRYKTLSASAFFEDGKSARPLVDGTIARGQLREDQLLYTGKVDNKDADIFPFPITKEVLERGQQRFNIACAHCHDKLGTGNGIIVQRGFRKPPAYQIDRLRQAPVGHFFDVMTNGFGAMASHAYEVAVRDRWAIAAYIRVLQDAQPPAPETAQPGTAAKPGEAGQSPTAEGGQGTPAKAPTEQKPKTGEQQQ